MKINKRIIQLSKIWYKMKPNWWTKKSSMHRKNPFFLKMKPKIWGFSKKWLWKNKFIWINSFQSYNISRLIQERIHFKSNKIKPKWSIYWKNINSILWMTLRTNIKQKIQITVKDLLFFMARTERELKETKELLLSRTYFWIWIRKKSRKKISQTKIIVANWLFLKKTFKYKRKWKKGKKINWHLKEAINWLNIAKKVQPEKYTRSWVTFWKRKISTVLMRIFKETFDKDV